MTLTRRERRRYVHALGFRSLNRMFDPLLRATMQDARFKAALLEQAGIEPGHNVLDLGCGTGTLLLMLQAARPDVTAMGIDGDWSILALAAAKGRRAGQRLRLVTAFADRLPFAANRFDRVVSTLLLHHLDRATKCAALAEVFRVLRPGGEIHIADWGRPHTRTMRVLAAAVGWLDGVEVTADNYAGRLPGFMREAGFEEVAEPSRRATVFGTLSFYTGRKPAASASI